MPTYTLQYAFRQQLQAPARAAFSWCTDFEPKDGRLFPVRWERSVRRLSEGALILADTTYPEGHRRRIHRLVRLYPSELAWTNTHLDGPFRHSQFLYQIVAEGPRRSHLSFHGTKLVRSPGPLAPGELDRRAAEEMRSDSSLWRGGIAPALQRELAPRAKRR